MEYLPRWSRATSVISAHADVDVPKISGDVPLIQFECRQDPEFMKVVGALGQIINLTDKNSCMLITHHTSTYGMLPWQQLC